MGGFQFLCERTPDSFFIAAVLFRTCFHKRTNAGALIEVGLMGVLAGSDIIDDLVARVEFGISRGVQTTHEVKCLCPVRRASANGAEQLLKRLERERPDLHLAIVLNAFELLADIGEGGRQYDANEGQVLCGEFGDDAHSWIAFDEKLKERFLAADDAVEKVSVVPKPYGDLLIGLHYMLPHMLERLSRGDNVGIGLALGNGNKELSAGIVKADRSGESKAVAKHALRIRRVCGDFIAAFADLVCRSFDLLDGFPIS